MLLQLYMLPGCIRIKDLLPILSPYLCNGDSSKVPQAKNCGHNYILNFNSEQKLSNRSTLDSKRKKKLTFHSLYFLSLLERKLVEISSWRKIDDVPRAYESIVCAIKQNAENMESRKSNPRDHTEHKRFKVE